MPSSSHSARGDRPDTATQSNYREIRTNHLHFDWTIDWAKQLVEGEVVHTLEAQTDGVSEAAGSRRRRPHMAAGKGSRKMEEDDSKHVSDPIPCTPRVGCVVHCISRRHNRGGS